MKNKPKFLGPKQAFELGDIILMKEVFEILDEDIRLQPILGRAIHNFSTGKWGKVDEKTAWKNDSNVKKGEGRLVGVFDTQFGTLEIINTWNRERTEIRFKQ